MIVEERPPRKERRLSDYRMSYLSDEYPLLAFLYAIYAGGEHTIYCDYSVEYFNKYCVEPFEKQGLPVPDYIRRVGARLGEFEAGTKGRTRIVHADAQDWDEFLSCLKLEMAAKTGPDPIW